MPKSFIPDNIEEYILALHNIRAPLEPYYQELREETSTLYGDQMLISISQGLLLQWLATIVSARNILEIGTFTGYSAIFLAKALPSDGKLYCLEKNIQYKDICINYWNKADVAHKINLIHGDAADILNQWQQTQEIQSENFDMAFIDADKKGYARYYEYALELTRQGGFIVLDNMLWKGQITDSSYRDQDIRLQSLDQLNQYIFADKRVYPIMLPLGDGLVCVCKR